MSASRGHIVSPTHDLVRAGASRQDGGTRRRNESDAGRSPTPTYEVGSRARLTNRHRAGVDCPPYSRSHGGRVAGSSDQQDRRNPLRSSPGISAADLRHLPATKHRATCGARPEALVVAARRQLLRQQASGPTSWPSWMPTARRATRRVGRSTLLRAAAQSVLAEIDAALRHINQCRYGRCGGYMSWDRVRALPMATSCGSCRRGPGRSRPSGASEIVRSTVSPGKGHFMRGAQHAL